MNKFNSYFVYSRITTSKNKAHLLQNNNNMVTIFYEKNQHKIYNVCFLLLPTFTSYGATLFLKKNILSTIQ